MRALAFFSLVTAIVALIFVNRSFSASIWAALFRPNRALKFVLLGVVGCLSDSPVAGRERSVPLRTPFARSCGDPRRRDCRALGVLEILKAVWRSR